MTVRTLRAPSLGERSQAGVIVLRWRIAVGDRVRAGEVLADLETEKAYVELVADVSGIVRRVLARAGGWVAVGERLIEIEEETT